MDGPETRTTPLRMRSTSSGWPRLFLLVVAAFFLAQRLFVRARWS